MDINSGNSHVVRTSAFFLLTSQPITARICLHFQDVASALDESGDLGTDLEELDMWEVDPEGGVGAAPDPPDYSRLMSALWISSCCVDTHVAYLVGDNGDATVHNASKAFTVKVKGVALGRTSIKFKVKKNASFR